MGHDVGVLDQTTERSNDRTADHEDQRDEEESTNDCQEGRERTSIGNVVLGFGKVFFEKHSSISSRCAPLGAVVLKSGEQVGRRQ